MLSLKSSILSLLAGLLFPAGNNWAHTVVWKGCPGPFVPHNENLGICPTQEKIEDAWSMAACVQLMGVKTTFSHWPHFTCRAANYKFRSPAVRIWKSCTGCFPGSRNPHILHPHCQAQLTFPGPIRSGSPTHIKHLSSMILLIYINSFRPILAWQSCLFVSNLKSKAISQGQNI